jgi:hypothetical protein
MRTYGPRTLEWDRARQLFDASLQRYPSIVLCPDSTSEAIEVISGLQAAGEKFTLKSGGHSAAGLSVMDNVPLVDLSGLRSVYVDLHTPTATVEAGALMVDLDNASGRVGMATTGGTVSHTGVVGLATGGGLGWLMGRFGLACDNIVRARIVRAGTEVVVDEASPDMTILRGSGSTLGFIAELTLRLHPIEPRFQWSTFHFDGAASSDCFIILSRLLESIPPSVGASFVVKSNPSGDVAGTIDAISPTNDIPAGGWLDELTTKLGLERHTRHTDYKGIQRMQDAEFPFGSRSYRRSLCLDIVSPKYIHAAVGILTNRSHFHRSVTLDVLHGRAMSKRLQRQSVFPRRRYVGLLISKWEDPTLDAEGREVGRDMYSTMLRMHSQVEPLAYGNYSSEPGDSPSSHASTSSATP